VINRGGKEIVLAARVSDSASGRVMEVHTTQPGMQFYTANHLVGEIKGKGNAIYKARAAYCFETQHFPDSPNQPAFPTSELNPGEQFQESTIFRFSAA
jgi:aldose 1-epimerase